jgi:hypothetical protein
MIRYRPQATASGLDDAISYLKTKVTKLAAEGWDKVGDIVVTETRNATAGTRVFRAATTLTRAE